MGLRHHVFGSLPKERRNRPRALPQLARWTPGILKRRTPNERGTHTSTQRALYYRWEKPRCCFFFCQWTILIGSILTWQKNTNSHFTPLIVFVLFLTQSVPINITRKSDEGLAKGRDFHQTTVTNSGDLVSEWSHCSVVGLSRWVFCQFNILVLNKRFFSLRKQKSSWDGRNVEQVDRTLWK